MNFLKYTETGEKIVKEVATELGFPNDKELAGRVLRAVLHALRSRLTIQQSFHLMAQFPMMIKAIYVDGWKYQEKPLRIKHIGDFVREVIHEDWPLGHHDIRTAKDGENVIRAVFKVIGNHVSEGAVKDIIVILPPDLRALWGEPATHEVK